MNKKFQKAKIISSALMTIFFLLMPLSEAANFAFSLQYVEAGDCYRAEQHCCNENCQVGQKAGCEKYGSQWWCFDCGRGKGCYKECKPGYCSRCMHGERYCCPCGGGEEKGRVVGRVQDNQGRIWDTRSGACGNFPYDANMKITWSGGTALWDCNPEPYYKTSKIKTGTYTFSLTPPSGYTCESWNVSYPYGGATPKSGTGCQATIPVVKGDWGTHLWFYIKPSGVPQPTCPTCTNLSVNGFNTSDSATGCSRKITLPPSTQVPISVSGSDPDGVKEVSVYVANKYSDRTQSSNWTKIGGQGGSSWSGYWTTPASGTYIIAGFITDNNNYHCSGNNAPNPSCSCGTCEDNDEPWVWQNCCKGCWMEVQIEEIPTNLLPEGEFTQADCNGFWGWAWDPDTPSALIDVHFYADGPAQTGVFVGSVSTDMYRGFYLPTPESLKDGKTHQIYAYGKDVQEGTLALLDGSPKTINCGPAVEPPTVDIKANGSDGPITIPYNSSATLSWTSTNATSCQASGAWSGTKPLSGSESTGNLTTGTYTYTLTCQGAGGTASDSVTVNVEAQLLPALTISKLARNLTQGQTTFADTISANPLDQIEFRIQITSTGSANVSNVQVQDVLPWQLTYQGNLKVDGASFSGDILSGINLGTLTPGQTKTITFEAQVVAEENFNYGTTSLVNTGKTWADSVSQIVDTAVVNVTRTAPSPVSPGLTISKLVRNITDNTTFQESVLADPQDRVEFQIKVTSIGSTTAYNVIVRDVLPPNLSYQGNLKIDGISSSGDILSGLNLGSMAPGLSKTITFEAQVASAENFAYGTTALINTAYVRADEVSEISDSAILNVTREGPSQVALNIEKTVKNLTTGQRSWYESISASPSDKIAFKIVVTSTGNQVATNVTVKDILPDKIAWYGNLKIDDVSSGFDITEGVSIGNLAPGQSKTITFEVLLSPNADFPYGTTELTNTAIAFNADTSVSDTAKVRVFKKAVAGAVTEVPTGIVNSLLTSLGVTILLTYILLLGFFFYQKVFVRSGINLRDQVLKAKSRMEEWYWSLHILDSPEKSEKRFQKIISEIRAKEA